MKLLIAALVATVVATSRPAFAQQLEVPRASPNAKLTQTAGITDITIEYSSPGVKGREIWGKVVAYGDVWRAGANAATKITFSKDVTIAGTNAPAGTYSFFVIPKQSGPWTLIVNKVPNQSGAFDYKQAQDLVRVDVAPAAITPRERLAYLVSNFSEDAATIDLEWEKIRLSLPITLHTEAQVAANLKALEDGAWEPYSTAANFYRTVQKDYTKALSYADKSISVHETWRNDWEKAQILAAKGDKKEAHKLAEKVQTLAKDAPSFFQGEIKKALNDWK